MGKETKKAKQFSTNELRELTYIRKLLMLQLVRDGVNSEVIADVLGIDASTVRHLIPMRKIKKKKEQ